MSLINALDAWRGGTDPDTGDAVTLLRVFVDAITGELSQAGLRNGGKITEVELNTSTWVPLPATPQTDRNALAIQNRSGVEIKINYVTDSGEVGVIIPNNGERFYGIKDSIIMYAKAVSGTPTIIVEELS